MRQFLLGLIALFLFGCNASKKAAVEPTVTTEFRQLDTVEVVASAAPDIMKPEDYKLPVYHSAVEQAHDLLHTKLEISFDWKKQRLLGKAMLTLTPYFYPTDKVALDAKNFDIHSVKLASNNKVLEYTYDSYQLAIQLDKIYQQTDTINLWIDYTAKPTEREEMGGSAAITSDQGLFFVNHDGSEPNTPMQIWTQGETENNSYWFPTFDKPNERCTQEIYITIEDRFKTLSNGLLASSTKNENGTRTDYWTMDMAHAPYLFMLAIGEYAVVNDTWENIPLAYYVEPEYKEDATDIFAHTPEMLSFFSEKLGVKYPWPKYSQVIVREFVSGAMENTTSVIFGDFVQKHKRELIDNHNDGIVAHEMFHHWFGDLVTCESWSNLTMNEGFANYSEYLWFEHKYGKDEADFHRMNELNGYFGSAAQQGMHPLIWFEYSDKEEMFDAHSYNKGGLVLHMLRNYVGDKAFFAALQKYLKDHSFSSVEAHDLRLAFEAVTGKDLNWFFKQWFFSSGHPILNVSYDYDESIKKMNVIVEQVQDPENNPPIFILPFAIDLYDNEGKATRFNVVMNERIQTFSFKTKEEPSLINVDADRILLCQKIDKKANADAYVFQLNHAPQFFDKFEAIQVLKNNKKDDPTVQTAFKNALNDPFWNIRLQAISALNYDERIADQVKKMAQSDKHSEVRAAAIEYLAQGNAPEIETIAKYVIDNDKAYPPIGAALNALNHANPEEAAIYAAKLENEKVGAILNAIGAIYKQKEDKKFLSFFEQNWHYVDQFDAFEFFGNYIFLLSNLQDDDTVLTSSNKLKTVAIDLGQSMWRRYAATSAIREIRDAYQEQANQVTDVLEKEQFTKVATTLANMITEIKAKETSGQLKAFYDNF